MRKLAEGWRKVSRKHMQNTQAAEARGRLAEGSPKLVSYPISCFRHAPPPRLHKHQFISKASVRLDFQLHDSHGSWFVRFGDMNGSRTSRFARFPVHGHGHGRCHCHWDCHCHCHCHSGIVRGWRYFCFRCAEEARKKRGSSAEAFHVLVLRWPQGLKPEMKRRKKGADDARCPPALSSDDANGHQG